MRQLTAKFVAAVTAPGKHYDGDAGLYLYVRERAGNVSKAYVQRLTIDGKRADIGLGSTKWTTLTEARATAQVNRKIARQGGDPRRRPAAVPSLEEAADSVIAMHSGTWRDGGKTEARWRSTLAAYVFPRLGRKSVADITTADVLAVLTHDGFWSTKRETARKVRQRISAIMDWAAAEEHRTDNPCHALKAALPKAGRKTQHQRALPFDRVSGAVGRVRVSGAYPTTKLAFELLVLTATRSGEVRRARWEEFDLDATVWTIPGERTKTGRPHRIPLSPRALDVLRDAAEYRDRTGLVFPSARGLTMSDMTISKLIKELGIEAVPHGFRSSFRMWAAERTSTPREVCEFALGHVVGAEAERAYQRSDLFDKRRALMESWAAYLGDGTATVIRIAG